MGVTYEIRRWIDDSFYFRVDYAAQPFCRVRDTGHEFEILFAPGRGPKEPGPYYAETFKQAKRWVFAYGKHHEAKLRGERMKTDSCGVDPLEPWPWPNAADVSL